MEEGRIIIKATLTNTSPLIIGSGKSDFTDKDLVLTRYPITDDGTKILAMDQITSNVKFAELPFIPATSFAGKLYRYINSENDSDIQKFWGDSEINASYIDCSDVLLAELPGAALKEVRDGIRLNPATGTVAKGAKFNFEVLPPGAKFNVSIILRVDQELKKLTEEGDKNQRIDTWETAKLIVGRIKYHLQKGIEIGGKATIGMGRMSCENLQINSLDFNKPNQFDNWIAGNYEKGDSLDKELEKIKTDSDSDFVIEATFRIKNSLIIRSYSTDPALPDATHLKSGGKNILSGSSIKGALRGRAEKILNTIQNDLNYTEVVLAGLFGDVEKEEDKERVKKNGYTVPSRVFVDEVNVNDVKEEIQTRIQIDRFTGGTVEGALIEEAPLFPSNDSEQIKDLKFGVRDANAADKGLMLLLLKDLWTSDLPIGGEKSIGRGVLEGICANVSDNGRTFSFPEVFEKSEDLKTLQKYVDALNNKSCFEEYSKRVNKYKTHNNGK